MERNISIHISDRSHLNLTLNVYNCGNEDVAIEKKILPDAEEAVLRKILR